MGSTSFPNGASTPRSLSRTTSFLLSTPIGRRSNVLELQNSTQKRKLEALQVESASKLQKHANTIESLNQRIDKLESDRKRLFDENIRLKSAFEEQQTTFRAELQTQEQLFQDKNTLNTSLHEEVSSLKSQVNMLSMQLEQQREKYRTDVSNLQLEASSLKQQTASLEAIVENKNVVIKELQESIAKFSVSQEYDPELRDILKEAAKNSQVISIKYRRLLKEVQSLRSAPAEKLLLEEALKKQQIKLDLLESTEKRCHELELELERVKSSGMNTDNDQLKQAKETIETLREEFEALNDSNSTLHNKLSIMEAERAAFQKTRSSLLDRIAELENVNRTLETLIQNK